MESWQRVWREGTAPLLSTPSLKALLKALEEDDSRLIQRATTEPPALQCVQSWPVKASCLLGFCAWEDLKQEGWPDISVGDISERFARLCYEIDNRLGEPAACRYLLNWFDDAERTMMRECLLEEVKRTLDERETKMEKQNVSFVKCSELFDGCPLALELFEECPTLMWGGNGSRTHTLVTPTHIKAALHGNGPDPNELILQCQVDEVIHRLSGLGSTLVDLEN